MKLDEFLELFPDASLGYFRVMGEGDNERVLYDIKLDGGTYYNVESHNFWEKTQIVQRLNLPRQGFNMWLNLPKGAKYLFLEKWKTFIRTSTTSSISMGKLLFIGLALILLSFK